MKLSKVYKKAMAKTNDCLSEQDRRIRFCPQKEKPSIRPAGFTESPENHQILNEFV